MRYLFIGCVESSYRLLKILLEHKVNIAGVLTKRESNFNSDFVDLVPLCKCYNIDWIQIENINDDESKEFILKKRAEVGLCLGWSQLVKSDVIDMFSFGIIGFHPAKLPYNRGRHPLIWALMLGLEETASTFFMIDKTADTGDIISQELVDIAYEDDAASLYDKVMQKAEIQICEIVDDIENKKLIKTKQVVGGNEWRKRGKMDGVIDWRMSTRAIYNLVRSLTRPYIGASFLYNEKEYKVWKVEEIFNDTYRNIEPGKVLELTDDYVDIKAYNGVIRLLEFEKVELKIGEYL